MNENAIVLREYENYSPVHRIEDVISVEHIREVITSFFDYEDTDEQGLSREMLSSVVELGNEIYRLREEVEYLKEINYMMEMSGGQPPSSGPKIYATPETVEYVKKLLEESE